LNQKSSRILDAAEGLFLANGIRATTMEAIAREAGVSKPTLYGRFPDKEAVFRDVSRRVHMRLREEFAAKIEREGSVEDRIGNALAATYRAIYMVLRQSVHASELIEANQALAKAEKAELFDWMRDEIARILEDGGYEDARHRADILLAAADGLKMHAVEGEALSSDIRLLANRLLAR